MFLIAATFLAFFGSNSLLAQTVYVSDSSLVGFYSETPLENIMAQNRASTSLIDLEKRKVQFRVPVSAFEFHNKLMQEHFNEGYLEPDKFPTATFNGTFADSLALEADSAYSVSATGFLSMHGVQRMGTYQGILMCEDSVFTIQTEFTVRLDDFGVKVPGVVFENIAREIQVKVFFRYVPHEKKQQD